MCYSIEPRERRYVTGYGFLSLARNLGTHSIKVKNINNKYLKLLAKEQFKKQLKQLEI